MGKSYEGNCIATGYGNYLAVVSFKFLIKFNSNDDLYSYLYLKPIMREFLEKNNNKITEAQARDVLDRCMKLLYFRDGRAYDKYSMAIVTKDGVRMEDQKQLVTNWQIATKIA